MDKLLSEATPEEIGEELRRRGLTYILSVLLPGGNHAGSSAKGKPVDLVRMVEDLIARLGQNRDKEFVS